jgi:Ni/Fe-hydrogenase 1 B-type cytochrome subunit
MLKRILVWSTGVRIAHWLHFASVAVLAVTGLYIAYPFVQAADVGFNFVMGTVRFAHFSAAAVFVATFIWRLYWFSRANPYEGWRDWLPLTSKQWQGFVKMLKYYLFLSSERPPYVAVNPVAGFSYALLFILIAIQMVTGFAMLALPYASGIWRVGFMWINIVFGAQPVRWLHHVLLWAFVIFFLVHLYMVLLSDIEERTGGVTSMISGVKWQSEEEETI